MEDNKVLIIVMHDVNLSLFVCLLMVPENHKIQGTRNCKFI